jgi:mannosyl-oligosaccharide alpha-1,2-mannosidase
MAFTRRYITVLLFAVLTIFVLLHIYRLPDPQQPPGSYKASPKVNDGKFLWNNTPIHYPLQKLTQLPLGTPQKLPAVQHVFSAESEEDRRIRLERRQHVRDAFEKCWRSYKKHAWMRDELSPVSGKGIDSFGGWAATLVDALDTLWIMDFKDDFREATTAAADIDFSKSTDEDVNVFETTIRYLGGFLAAYDLSGDVVLLNKAIEVGEMLLVPFDTPNRMPITRWKWKQAASGSAQEAPTGMLVSELGSLSVEFTRLSQLTGDMRWYDAVARITQLFDEQQDRTKIPGLWPIIVNPRDEDLTADTGFTFGGMSDSLYEYFPKEYALLGGLSPVYRKLYEGSIKAAKDRMFFRPLTPDNKDILMSGDARARVDGSSSTLQPKNQHLTCFTGGMLGLGGRLFSNEEHVQLARRLTEGCIWAYKSGPRGVMPEIAHFVPCSADESCSWDRERWIKAVILRQGSSIDAVEQVIANKKLPEGFTEIDDSRYILRPEAIESVFIMYRITGDPYYREAAWEMFTAIQNITQTDLANAAIVDITATAADGLPPKNDRMESFWLAETLKYFYLIYSEPDLISLDEYVLNTEAHPLRRPT